MPFDPQIVAEPIETARLSLEPLGAEHAVEMAPLLDDPRLHEFIGGSPATLAELQRRYSHLARGRSADGTEAWLNWIARLRDTQAVVGTVQATVRRSETDVSADIAWVIGTQFQRHGYAREASLAMGTWLQQHGVTLLVAYIHPDHAASEGVATHLGMHPTEDRVDGEVRWVS